ncbi:MAG: hypothetical protein WC480_04260 [Patescibacteria group bacterium]
MFSLKQSFKTGISFGLTSGIITTLGLMVGLHSGTNSKLAVIGGIITIAIADALSDALGMHIAEEAKDGHNKTEIWESTIATFAAKFIFALTFIVPVVSLPLGIAMWTSIAWGFLAIALLSLVIARSQGIRPWEVIGEHLFILLLVVVITHFVGDWVARVFG